MVYENGVQKLLLTEEGYVTLSDSKYHYYLKDHQGNNRVVINQSGTVEETSHYYPFGGVFASAGNVQPYKYNGKEYDSKKGLNWYDYGARHYDAALGRFMTVDPLLEKYYRVSPYTYCYDNPILYIDPAGKWGETVWDAFNLITGVQSLTDNVKSGNVGAAIVDGVGIILDAGATLLPVIPGGASTAIKAARGANKAGDAIQAMNRERKNEAKVLESIGEAKNTKSMKTTLRDTKEKVTVIPDAVTDTKVIEIKDTKAVYNTKQIRGEQQIAKKEGKKFEIITGEKTHVSGNVKADEIVRRKDIGPQ